MIYFTKPSGRVKQANPVFAPPRASNWLASLAVIGLFASPAYGQATDPNAPDACATDATSVSGDNDGSTAVGCGAVTERGDIVIQTGALGSSTTDVPTLWTVRVPDSANPGGFVEHKGVRGVLAADGTFTLMGEQLVANSGLGNAGDEVTLFPATRDANGVLILSTIPEGGTTRVDVVATGAVTASVDRKQTAVGASSRARGSLNTAIGANSQVVGFRPRLNRTEANHPNACNSSAFERS